MLKILLDVVWPERRVVRVALRALPLIRYESLDRLAQERSARALNPGDVASMEALRRFLTIATRSTPEGATVDVVAFEPDVDVLLELLDVEGPPVDAITVVLAA